MLDNITLLLASSVTNLLLAASPLAFRKPPGSEDPARLWSRGKLVLGLAEALYLLAPGFPAYLRTTLPNTLGAAGLGLEVLAVWEILGFTQARRRLTAVFAGLVLYQLALGFFHLSSPTRIGLVCIGIIAEFALLTLAYALKWRERAPLVRSLAVANGLLVAAYVIRVAEAFAAGPGYTVATRAWGQSLTFAALFLATQINGFGFILALKERAEAQLQRWATLDALTETLNRRGFSDIAGRLVGIAERSGEPLTAMLCDIDQFKRINDRSGHALGDEILRRLARLMKENLRSTDLIGRFGGDEFVVLLPQTALPGALKVATIINRKFSQALQSDGDDPLTATLSIGVAERRAKESFEDLIERADRALYQAKEAGRDRVESDPPTLAPGRLPARL